MVGGQSGRRSFGQTLHRLRLAAGLTQEALAERSGVSVDAISALENGRRRRPRQDTIEMLARGLRLGDEERRELMAAAREQGRPRTAPRGQAVDQPPDVSDASAAAPMWTLPRDVAAFTGREEELDRLVAGVSDMTGSGRVVGIGAIEGMAGIGKTAFAIHAAHRLAPRFPDGQLFLDLHAHTAGRRPVTPADALGTLLLTLGVSAQLIPPDVDGRAALWRDRLAGKRMLLVLDDAAGHEQVRPLLPGAPGCLVLVTSRHRLAALEGVEALTLGTLPLAEAARLFTRLAGARRALKPAAVAELVELCGSLPLAIGLLAGRLRSHPSWTVHHLTDTLRDARDRLAEIHAENIAVDSAFQLSYRDLPADRQRLFRRLGLPPGRDVDAYAAAALDGADLAGTQRRLDGLYNHHLIEEPHPGRYRLHDLIRDYARTLASREDGAGSEAAIDRLLDYYVHTATVANRQIAERAGDGAPVAHPPAEAPDLQARRRALAWLEAERPNLRACLDHAAAHGRHDRAVRLGGAMHAFLRLAGHWDQAVTVHQTALTSARVAGDRPGQAVALSDLGTVAYLTDDYPAATACLTEALTLYRDLGDRLGQADVLNALGRVQSVTSEYAAATSSLTDALALYEDLGDRLGQANALHNLGTVAYRTGEYAAATSSLARALALHGELSHPSGQADALSFLGVVQRLTGDYAAATASLTEALRLFGDLSDRHGQAYALQALGVVEHLTGRREAAGTSLDEALALFRDLGDRLGQAEALNHQGSLLLDTSAHHDALDRHRQAVQLARGIRSPLEEARALEGIGRCLLRGGDAGDAGTHLRRALAIYRRIGAPEAEQVQAALDDVQTSTAAGSRER